MLRRSLSALAPAAALALAGCGTAINQSNRNYFAYTEPHTSNRAFGGVRVDATALAQHYAEVWDGDRDVNANCLLAPAVTLLPDLALCLFADTLLLPYDLWATAAGRATTAPPLVLPGPRAEQADDCDKPPPPPPKSDGLPRPPAAP